MKVGNQTFDYGCEMVDVTSMHRPDTSWLITDTHGHPHRWYVDGQPADGYRPDAKYETPTLVWIKDGEEYWEDSDEPHEVGHLECRECGEHIEPHYTADSCTAYVPGLRWYRIDGQHVSKEEFERRVAEAKITHFAPPA